MHLSNENMETMRDGTHAFTVMNSSEGISSTGARRSKSIKAPLIDTTGPEHSEYQFLAFIYFCLFKPGAIDLNMRVKMKL